ncbi:hypothetical protein G5714_004816 [Onychostoma macrolepis]|uniref:Uncharacterized protein n=1 Tax=Onychostoma macrolepis TaxID=369639 RepID=A0A7J6D5Q8_9TELE|nr:hypothetical protein G5714_004816 [Onychostoma macrolepis]
MNSMFLVWTLSSLILSYTLGFPILNGTSSGSHMETLINVTMGNITEFNEINLMSGPGCSLATCAIQDLVDRMQIGDEKAGDRASDAWGPGKK